MLRSRRLRLRRRLATTSYDCKLRLYDRDGRLLLRPVATRRSRPDGLAFNPKDGRLAVGFADAPAVALYDGATLAARPAPDAGGIRNGSLAAVAWSVDGATLFAAGQYHNGGSYPVVAWDRDGTGLCRSLMVASNTVMSLRALADGTLQVAAADPWLGLLAADGTTRWAQRPAQIDLRDPMTNRMVGLDGMSASSAQKTAASKKRCFDVAALALLPSAKNGLTVSDRQDTTVPAPDSAPLPLDRSETTRSLAVAPGRTRFLLGTERQLRAFEAAGAELWMLPAPTTVWSVNVTGDGRLAVAAYADGTLRWHRMDDGAELLALPTDPRRELGRLDPRGRLRR